MIYGVTDLGFVLKRLVDFKREFEETFKNVFGEIDVDEDSVYGQLIGIMSKFFAENFEQIEKVYNLFNVLSSSGVNLDRLLALTLHKRLPATSTKVYVQFEGEEGTVIPANFKGSVVDTGELFDLPNSITISKENACRVELDILTAADKNYSISINSTSITVNGSGLTRAEIALALVNRINSYYSTIAKAAVIEGSKIKIDSLTQESVFSFDISSDNSSDISLDKIWSPGICYSVNKGRILAVANTLTNIETPYTGLNAISNFYDGQLGREIEKDDEVRVRRNKSLKINGGGNLEAIASKIAQLVEGVTKVLPYENATDSVDSYGRPPHSGEFVVDGGETSEIAKLLWQNKPAGIQLVGNTTVTIQDSQGYNQTFGFSRPVTKYAHLRITINSYYNEEEFPSNGASIIKSKVLEFAESLSIGKDIILQRFVGPIYTNVPGIAQITIEGAITDLPGDTPIYSEDNIALGPSEIANFDSTRIFVIE